MRKLTLGTAFIFVVCFGNSRASAQSYFQPYVVQGPTIVLSHVNVPGCHLVNENFGTGKLTKACVSISYDTSQATSASIALQRYLLVPTGNLLFEFPVVSDVVSPDATIDFGVEVSTVNADPQAPKTSPQGNSVEFHGPTRPSAAVIQVPAPVDWAESVTTFSISVDVRVCGPSRDPEHPCSVGSGQFTGPDLSSISLGSIYPSGTGVAMPGDGFLIIGTPAAGFQLPLLPTTLLYGPLGNGSQAKSIFTITNIVGTNQQFTDTNDQTHALTHDDKSQWQGGVTLSLSYKDTGKGAVACADGTTCKLSLGLNFSQSWDNSAETDNEVTYGTTGSVVTQNQMQVSYTVPPRQGQPSLDKITFATQPFWGDVFLAVTDPQYAVWDYPAGPVIQPLGAASVVVLPVLQLDSCKNSTTAIQPTSIVAAQWGPNQSFAVGTVLVDSNNQIQVATTSGQSGGTQPLPQWQAYHIYSANASVLDANSNKQTVTKGGLSGGSTPAWTPNLNGITNDGSVVWANGGPAAAWGFNYGDKTTDGTVTWTNSSDQFGVYKSGVAQDTIRFVPLGTWKAGQAVSTGSLILGPGLGSIQVATAAGTSGASSPIWNTTDEATTADGTVTWTNEKDHFVVYAAPVAQRMSAYQWLPSDSCKDILSLDQFYAKGAQSAYPIAYRVLGNQLSLSPSVQTSYSNQNQTVTSVGQSYTTKQTLKVTSVFSNSLGASGALDFGLKLASFVLGVDVTGGVSQTSTTTTVDTSVDSQSLQSTTTVTGQWTASTSIQDGGSEQSIPANVLQDSIFMGVAVQDPSMNLAPSGTSVAAMANIERMPSDLQGLPTVPIGRSTAMLRKNGSSVPATYAQQTNYGYAVVVGTPSNSSQIREQLRGLHDAAAHRHTLREVSAPRRAKVRILSRREILGRLKGMKPRAPQAQEIVKELMQERKP